MLQYQKFKVVQLTYQVRFFLNALRSYSVQNSSYQTHYRLGIDPLQPIEVTQPATSSSSSSSGTGFDD